MVVASDKIARSTIPTILGWARRFMQVRAIWLKSSAITLVVIAISLTAGCGVVPLDRYDSPISIRRDGDGLSVVICSGIKADRILMQEPVTPEDDWYTFFEAAGAATLARGDDLIRDSRDRGMKISDQASPNLQVGAQIVVIVDGLGTSFTSIFTLQDELSKLTWLHPDGSTSAVPCQDK